MKFWTADLQHQPTPDRWQHYLTRDLSDLFYVVSLVKWELRLFNIYSLTS
jgi:hypothetical protein